MVDRWELVAQRLECESNAIDFDPSKLTLKDVGAPMPNVEWAIVSQKPALESQLHQ